MIVNTDASLTPVLSTLPQGQLVTMVLTLQDSISSTSFSTVTSIGTDLANGLVVEIISACS